jgi:hypothetical protein
LLVDGLVTEAAKIHGLAVDWPVVQGLVANFPGRSAAFVGWRMAHRPLAQGRQECLRHCGV